MQLLQVCQVQNAFISSQKVKKNVISHAINSFQLQSISIFRNSSKWNSRLTEKVGADLDQIWTCVTEQIIKGNLVFFFNKSFILVILNNIPNSAISTMLKNYFSKGICLENN